MGEKAAIQVAESARPEYRVLFIEMALVAKMETDSMADGGKIKGDKRKKSKVKRKEQGVTIGREKTSYYTDQGSR